MEEIKQEVVEGESTSNNKENNNKKYNPTKHILILVGSVTLSLALLIVPFIYFIKLFSFTDNGFHDHHIEAEEQKMEERVRKFDTGLLNLAEQEYRDLATYSESSIPISHIVSIDLKDDCFTYVASTHDEDVIIIDIDGTFEGYESIINAFDEGFDKTKYTINSSIGEKVDDEAILNRFKDNLPDKTSTDDSPRELVYQAYTFNNPDEVYISATFHHVDYYTFSDISYTISTDSFELYDYPKKVESTSNEVFLYLERYLIKNHL